MDIRKIYEYALQREYEESAFEQNANRLSHAVAAGTFKALADEEQSTLKFIQSLLNAMEKGLPQASTWESRCKKRDSFRSVRILSYSIRLCWKPWCRPARSPHRLPDRTRLR